jgi:hypothetical protein
MNTYKFKRIQIRNPDLHNGRVSICMGLIAGRGRLTCLSGGEGCTEERGGEAEVSVLCAGLRIRINFIRIRIQHTGIRLNTDPDPGLQ